MPRFNSEFDFVPVPKEFIKQNMPQANGAYLKVYLYALMLAYNREEMSTADIADNLSLIESDVINALKAWEKEGVLRFDGENVLFGNSKKLPVKEETASAAVNKKSMQEIAEEMTENKDLAELCALSQEILGKPLKNREIETLYWFYDELGLSPEVITMLLEYCVSKDKRNMNYIEKVAISWHENGIVTIDAAAKYISMEKEKNGYMYSLKKLFGFDDRNFSKTEETYLKTWRDECGMDENMVGLAYEYCIDAIHKISFPYMDRIIKRWKELGIETVEAAAQDHEDFKKKSKNRDFDIFNDSSSDYDEIEKIIREKM